MIADNTNLAHSPDSTTRRIIEILIDELKLEDVTPDTFDVDLHLVDELGIDSMDLTAVVLVLQDEYGITIYEEDYPKLQTVREIASFVAAARES